MPIAYYNIMPMRKALTTTEKKEIITINVWCDLLWQLG